PQRPPGQRPRRLPVGAALPPAPDPALDARRQGLRLEARAGRPRGDHEGRREDARRAHAKSMTPGRTVRVVVAKPGLDGHDRGAPRPRRSSASSAGTSARRSDGEPAMDFEPTDDQTRIRRVAREFAEGELGDKIAPYDERHEFPHAIVKKLGPLGFLGVLVPEAYGGAGLDHVSYARIVAAFILEKGVPGFSAGSPYRKLGLHASDTAELILEDARVPAASLLGERGAGFAQAVQVLEGGRIAMAAMAVGIAQAAVDQSVK